MSWDSYMHQALEAASLWVGNTSPNPPVGAVAIKNGRVVGIGAHEKAGSPHAEINALTQATEAPDTMVVTLEPCAHHGKTPPCADALLRAGVKTVVIGSLDPNPKAQGSAVTLKREGLQVITGVLETECKHLLRQFTHHTLAGLPFLTFKTVLDPNGSMIPPRGHKTFSSESSLTLAHQLRKRCDGILTGSGTILADFPEFTVRKVEDFRGKKRQLAILDRRGRVPTSYLEEAKQRGFNPWVSQDFQTALKRLGASCMEVLVEAGPTLRQSLLPLCQEEVLIQVREHGNDEIEVRSIEASKP